VSGGGPLRLAFGWKGTSPSTDVTPRFFRTVRSYATGSSAIGTRVSIHDRNGSLGENAADPRGMSGNRLGRVIGGP